jgi:hypothetical protein
VDGTVGFGIQDMGYCSNVGFISGSIRDSRARKLGFWLYETGSSNVDIERAGP